MFNQAFVRRWGRGVAGLWKLEFQQRGAAHFHLLALGLADVALPTLRAWIAQRWFDIVGSGDERHLRAGTQADVAKSINGVMCYLASYIAKDDQTRPGNFTGRYWGKFNGRALPVSPVESFDLTEREGDCLARWMRKKMEKDVNQSRWKTALARPGQACAVLGWSRVELERYLQTLPESLQNRKHEIFKNPRRYKARDNRCMGLIVDAAEFLRAYKRGRAMGLFETPSGYEGGGGEWRGPDKPRKRIEPLSPPLSDDAFADLVLSCKGRMAATEFRPF